MIQQYVRPATLEDALAMAPLLREEDKAEIRAASGLTPERALVLSMETSVEAYTMHKDGELAGMFGVCPTPEETVGCVWLLATPVLVKHWRPFLRHARTGRDWLHKHYPVLWALADMRNTTHLKWLEWMGFNPVNVHKKYGIEQRPFIEVARKNYV